MADEIVAAGADASEGADQPDLDAERDARVIPIVRAVFGDLISDVFLAEGAQADYRQVVMKIMQKSLDADLNVVSDNPHIFSLLLDLFSAFNECVMQCKMPEINNDRLSKIGGEMMQLLQSANVPLGKDATKESQVKVLEDIKPQLEALFERESLTWLEIDYILKGLMNSVRTIEGEFTRNMRLSNDRMEAKILNIETLPDLTMSKLDWALMTVFDEIKADFEKRTTA